MKALDGANPHRLDRLSLAVGFVSLAVLSAIYLLVADSTGSPLALLGLAALFTASLSGPIETLIVGFVTTLVAMVLGVTDDSLDGPALVARLTIIVTSVLAAAWMVWFRHRREAQLQESAAAQRVLEVLQSRLATRPIPPAGLRVDVRYVPGDTRLALGGDFVDAITLPDGALGFVVGDVSGHGPDAAAFGVVLRAGWKSIAVEEPTRPDVWLHALQRTFFEDGRYDGFATAFVGRCRPGGRSMAVSSAGHCWPLVIGSEVRLFDPLGGLPLGVSTMAKWKTTRLDLARDDQVLLYTDGLIENRVEAGKAERFGEEGLVSWASGHPLDLDELLREVGTPNFTDDVALMLIREQG
jgi:hypothetical protein